MVFDGLVGVDDDGGRGGNGGGGGNTQVHALGGPSVPPPPERVHEANQAVAPTNMPSMSVTELVSHAEMSALNDVAS